MTDPIVIECRVCERCGGEVWCAPGDPAPVHRDGECDTVGWGETGEEG